MKLSADVVLVDIQIVYDIERRRRSGLGVRHEGAVARRVVVAFGDESMSNAVPCALRVDRAVFTSGRDGWAQN